MPAHDEAASIDAALDDLRDQPWVVRYGSALQVLVVDDGSADDTAARARACADRFAAVQVLQLPVNRGKGEALRAGLDRATGEAVAFVDADGTFDMGCFEGFLDALAAGADVVVGDRRASRSEYAVAAAAKRYVAARRLAGRGFNAVTRISTGLDVADSQCGLKLFTAAAARHCFDRVVVGRYVFDVELLIAAQQAGMDVASVPVRLRYPQPGPYWKVALMGGSLLRDLVRVHVHRLRGRYG
jgi:dolichyl-phosphate beta-glucosyltransferase